MEFPEATDEFLKYCSVERQLSHCTLQAYTADLADFRRWTCAGPKLSEISETTLKEYLASLVEERKLAPATVRRRFACLRAFFRWVADREVVTDPFSNWRLQFPRRKRLPRSLARPEISLLLFSFGKFDAPTLLDSKPFLPTVVRLMVATGIRVGELCKLKVDDISPDGASLRIYGKGSRDRIAYISDCQLRHELQLLIKQHRQNGRPNGQLFVNRSGSAIKPAAIRSKLRRTAIDVGLARRITPHMLRHTAATLLIETGVDIRFVQRLLGHSSIATTEIYTHVSDAALRTTLERADILGTFVPSS
jgi:site-specific recombinase XerD